jgi:2-C-methyl-D-erythritol 2,4-cyclodiphosphate synthase
MYRIGQGLDFHKLKKTKQSNYVRLGGVNIKSNYQIIAHSDGDLVLHAIANSILGAIQKGDIGEHFNDQDTKNRNLDSAVILKHAMRLMQEAKFEINNIDLTIVCQNIYLMKYKQKIRQSLIKLIKTPLINVKATRTETHSLLIACEVITLLKKK